MQNTPVSEQAARLDRLISLLDPRICAPAEVPDKQKVLRALMNVHSGEGLSPEFFALQDAELTEQNEKKGRVELAEIPPSPLTPQLRLWRGDITRLAVDAIVNAANSQLLGCFQPLHNCIDNIIHSGAGLQLRAECRRLMLAQGHEEPVGSAKITKAYNLPARWVLHTVGPSWKGLPPRRCNAASWQAATRPAWNWRWAAGSGPSPFAVFPRAFFTFHRTLQPGSPWRRCAASCAGGISRQ